LKFKIEADALVYLMQHHNGELMLRSSPRHGCCGGTVLLPVLEPGAPKDSEGWIIQEHQGLHIYIETGVDLTPETAVHIGIDRFLKWRKLWIEGLDAQIE
jgi:hypothetical protein